MKDTVIEMLKEQRSYDEIVAATGYTKATISYHAKKLGMTRPRNKRTYDWMEIAEYYETHTYTETIKKFSFAKRAWDLAVERGDIVSRGHNDKIVPLEEALVENSTYSRVLLKKRLIKEGILIEECSECGQGPEWNGKPLVLQLDHKNGINNDNRKVNLRLLCPNCHSQTETFAGRNSRKK
jgi:hypothetical protein